MFSLSTVHPVRPDRRIGRLLHALRRWKLGLGLDYARHCVRRRIRRRGLLRLSVLALQPCLELLPMGFPESVDSKQARHPPRDHSTVERFISYRRVFMPLNFAVFSDYATLRAKPLEVRRLISRIEGVADR